MQFKQPWLNVKMTIGISTTQLRVNCEASGWNDQLYPWLTSTQINGLSELQVKQPKIWVVSTNWFLQCT